MERGDERIGNDDTNLENFRQRLDESEYKYRILLANCTEAVAILTDDGTLKFISPSVEHILGFSDSEIMDMGLFAIIHPDDLVSATKSFEQILEEPSIPISNQVSRFRHKNGSWRWISGTIVNMLNDPLIRGIVNNFRDITQQKLADENLVRLNRLYAYISQINQAISHASDQRTLLKKSCLLATQIGKFTASWMTTFDSEVGQSLLFESYLSDVNLNFDDKIITSQILKLITKSAEDIVTYDANDKGFYSENSDLNNFLGSGSLIILQVKKMGEVVGNLALYCHERAFFTDTEIRLLKEAVGDLSYALDVLQIREDNKIAVEALREKEENLQAIFNSTSEGFILTDINGLILEYNSIAQQAVYDNSQLQLSSNTSIYKIFAENELEISNVYFNKISAGETSTFEYSFGDKWLKFKVSVVHKDGIINGFCISLKEITQQKLDKKKLRESESFSKNILSSLGAQIAVVNSAGYIIAVNKSWNDFFTSKAASGEPNSSIGSNYFEVCRNSILLGDDDAKETLNGILSVLNKEASNYQLEYPCHSPSEERWFALNVSPFGEDNDKVVILHQNITKRKIAENKLSQTSFELKKTLLERNQILDSSLDIICTINSNGEFVSVNKAIQAVLGYYPDEIIGTKFTNLVYAEDLTITAEAEAKIFNKIPLPLFENRYVHKNGRIVPLLWSVNYDEKLQLMFCIAKDISEQRRLEKAIKNERDQFYAMFLKAPAAIGMLKGENHVFEMANPLYLQLSGKTDIIGKTVVEVMPEMLDQGFVSVLDHVYKTGESYIDREVLVNIDADGTGSFSNLYINFVYQAYRNFEGEIDGVFFFINDITEQVLSKKTIEKSEKQYRQIVETAQEGIWLIDEFGKTTFVNKKMCEILEYSEEEMIGQEHTYFMHESDRDKAKLALTRRKDGVAENLEFTLISKNGRQVLTQISANPIFDESRNFKGSLGMVSDITINKHLENLLAKSNRLAKIGSWEIDVLKGTVFWSDITREIREVDADFVPDLATGISFFTEGKNLIAERVEQCIANGTPWDEELQLLTFKGNLKWVRTIGEASFVNGKCSKIYGSFQDITERKNAVEKILQSEAKLNIAQLIAQVGSWEVEIITNEHTWSEEFYRILEIDHNVTPSSSAFLNAIHPEDREMAKNTLDNAFAEKTDSLFNFRFTRKNGEVGYGSSEWKFTFNKDGTPYYLYGILRDLTDDKKAEMERQKMISDIIQRNKDLEQFSYIISHNLRSPVANIIGLTEELKDDSHSEETKLMLGDALNSDVKRLENVIADLNTILQTKREITEQKEVVNLTELVTDIEMGLSDLQKEGVIIKTDFSAANEINTIKSYIQSIFYNLISNSIKYRRPNIDAQIEIKSHLDNGNLLIIFRDNGIGVDLSKIGEQIFGLYKRFHTGTEGKGMGLYMVKTQVETLGGKISAKSELNVGAEFIIEFGSNQ